MARNPAERLRLAETGEELGAQGLRGRIIHAFEPRIAEACEHVGLCRPGDLVH